MEEVLELKENQLSQSEWLSHYESWGNTTLSKTEYCRRHHLKIDNFYSWCYRFKRKEADNGQNENGCFIPIVAKDIPVESNDRITAELSLPNDMRLKMSLYPKMLLKLIRELGDAATVIR